MTNTHTAYEDSHKYCGNIKTDENTVKYIFAQQTI